MADTLISLLAGDHDRQEAAARSARGLGSPEGIGVLTTLAESTETDVRAAAAANIASLVTAGHHNAITLASLRHCLNDPGTRVPSAIAATMANSPTRSPEALEILALLRSHPSARVRQFVARALPR
jgi:HEAT repeat protein